jgi:hypothetical protein
MIRRPAKILRRRYLKRMFELKPALGSRLRSLLRGVVRRSSLSAVRLAAGGQNAGRRIQSRARARPVLRVVERKKYGKKKARRSFQFSKR